MPNPCDQVESYGEASSSVFGTGLTSLIASVALATSLLISSETNVVTDTANATSTLIAPPGNDAVSAGAAQSVVSDRLAANNLLVATADVQTVAYLSADVLAVSSGSATSMLLSGKSEDAQSAGAASSSLFGGATRAPALAVSQGNASSVLLANPENLALNTADAVSTVSMRVTAGVTAISSGAAVSSIIDAQVPASFALAQASGESSVLSDVVAANTLLAQASGDSFVLLPAADAAWAMNLETTAMWRYAGYPLRWVAAVGNGVVGLTDAGLCVVSPANAVGWQLDSGWSDLGEPHKKRLTYTYVGGEYPPTSKLEVGVDILPAFYGYALTNSRATIGKGLNSRYWRFRFSGTGAASILDIRTDIATSARRI